MIFSVNRFLEIVMKMKPDQERVKALLSQTVMLLCKNGLHFEKELRIQGLLGITVDYDSVFIVHINESLEEFTSDNAAAAVFPAEDCNNLKEAVELQAPSGAGADDEKSASSDKFSNAASLTRHLRESSVNKRETLSCDDATEFKHEPNSEAGGDDVVLVESDGEQDAENALGARFEMSVPKRYCRNRFRPETYPCNGKRRRLAALPAPDSSALAFDDGAGNYAMKMEPVSSQNAESEEQDFVYHDSYSEQKWENSEPIFENADDGIAEDIPGCSSWERFDCQPTREMASTNSVPQANETYHESWTYAKFERRALATMRASSSHALASNPDNSVAIRQGGGAAIAALRRSRGGSTVKTVVCQYPDCGKTFCHSYHLYRHQREKHGRRFGVVSQTSFMCRFPECGRVFYRLASLWNHESLVHNFTSCDT